MRSSQLEKDMNALQKRVTAAEEAEHKAQDQMS